MVAKRINSRMWAYGNKRIWLNENAEGQRAWGVLSNSNVVLTNGFEHFHQAASYIEEG